MLSVIGQRGNIGYLFVSQHCVEYRAFFSVLFVVYFLLFYYFLFFIVVLLAVVALVVGDMQIEHYVLL